VRVVVEDPVLRQLRDGGHRAAQRERMDRDLAAPRPWHPQEAGGSVELK
jgi:hypothetical protein